MTVSQNETDMNSVNVWRENKSLLPRTDILHMLNGKLIITENIQKSPANVIEFAGFSVVSGMCLGIIPSNFIDVQA